MVVCQANGRPIEANLIQKKFKKLIKENNLPPVVFYSLRHSSINTRFMDRYYQSLLKLKAKRNKYQKNRNEYVTPATVGEIHKLLKSAFNKAVIWDMMYKNPCIGATLPQETSTEREIWTVETIAKALEVCDNDILSLAINLTFSCCLRSGEMLGLTWDNI